MKGNRTKGRPKTTAALTAYNSKPKPKSSADTAKKMALMALDLSMKIEALMLAGTPIPNDLLTLFKVLAPLVIDIRKLALEQRRVIVLEKNSEVQVKQLEAQLNRDAAITARLGQQTALEPISTFDAIAKTRDDASIALQKNLELLNQSFDNDKIKEATANIKALNELIADADEKIMKTVDLQILEK
jgi:hypothetical protein